MKITRWCVCGVLGTCGVLAALMTQPVQASDQKVYFKVDAGLSLVQDVKIKSGLGYEWTVDSTLGEIYPQGGGGTEEAEWIEEFFPGFQNQVNQDIQNGIIRPNGNAQDAVVEATVEGSGKPKCKFDPGFRVDLVGGYNISDAFALELEAGLLYNPFDIKGDVYGSIYVDSMSYGHFKDSMKIKDLDLWQIPILLNGVYTFKMDSKFKPFLGVGVGGIFTIIDGDELGSENDFTFAYQGMAGINYELSECVDIGLAYKFLGTLDHKFDDVKTDPILSHSFLASLTWRF